VRRLLTSAPCAITVSRRLDSRGLRRFRGLFFKRSAGHVEITFHVVVRVASAAEPARQNRVAFRLVAFRFENAEGFLDFLRDWHRERRADRDDLVEAWRAGTDVVARPRSASSSPAGRTRARGRSGSAAAWRVASDGPRHRTDRTTRRREARSMPYSCAGPLSATSRRVSDARSSERAKS